MSIEALSWAIKASRGKDLNANSKLVLWQIADSHNVENGSFLSQSTMADRVECSRATVNRCLDDLEAAGLIRRQQRIHPQTKKQLPTRYFLGFEENEAPQGVVARVSKLDTAFSGPTGAKAGEDPVDELPETDESRVSNSGGAVSHSSETLTLSKPINPLPPVMTPPPTISDLVGKWPADALGSIDKAEAAFGRLTIGQRHHALQMIDAYRAGIYRLRREPSRLATYLNDRLYEEFEDAPQITSGFFRITPDRPEWDRWVQHIRLTQGPAAAKRTVGQPFIAVSTRWPGAASDATRRAS